MINIIPSQARFVHDFIQPAEGRELFDRIYRKTQWEQQTIMLYGNQFLAPRLTAWHGDKGALYRHSGITSVPLPWYAELLEIRLKVENFLDKKFNSVLLNLYRNGNDGVGAHSDDEYDLGPNPVIVSVSLGETRRFIFHPKEESNGPSIKVNLNHGSLLVMEGQCQSHWKHSIPKTKIAKGPRINLTFRQIKSEAVKYDNI